MKVIIKQSVDIVIRGEPQSGCAFRFKSRKLAYIETVLVPKTGGSEVFWKRIYSNGFMGHTKNNTIEEMMEM